MQLCFIIALLCLAPRAMAVDSQNSNDPLSATGRTGAVGLELSLHKSHLKIGEPLFAKVILKNFSKKPLLVTEWVFRGSDDLGAEWEKNSSARIQTYLEIIDSKGNRMAPILYGRRPHVNPFEVEVSTPSAEEAALFASWRKEGADEKEIDARYRKLQRKREAEQRSKKFPALHLSPDAAIPSVSWCLGEPPADGIAGITCPGNGYVEIPFFAFKHPGSYRIRVVRDFRLGKALRKYEDEWCVNASTTWLPIEVSK